MCKLHHPCVKVCTHVELPWFCVAPSGVECLQIAPSMICGGMQAQGAAMVFVTIVIK